jgi:ABC-type transporter Mla MlaB component
MNDARVCESGTLTLSGVCAIRSAEDVYAKLVEAASGHAALEIDCSGIEEADLSLVQMLCAARVSAKRAGRSVRLAQPAAGALHDVLERGGFLSKDAAGHGFWSGKEDVS